MRGWTCGGSETLAPVTESTEAFRWSCPTAPRLPGGVSLWKLWPLTLQIACSSGAIIWRWRGAFPFLRLLSAGRTDGRWLAGSFPAAEMMWSWTYNWWAVGSCLMKTDFANLSGGRGVSVAEVSQSNTVFRASFSSSFLCWAQIRWSTHWTTASLWLEQNFLCHSSYRWFRAH